MMGKDTAEEAEHRQLEAESLVEAAREREMIEHKAAWIFYGTWAGVFTLMAAVRIAIFVG